MNGIWDHATPFDYGLREHGFTKSPSSLVPSFFMTVLKIPQGKTPDGLGLGVRKAGSSYHFVYWGTTFAGNIGPMPAVRDQWIMFIASAGDLGLVPGSDSWDAVSYDVYGGEAEWDVTTTLSSSSMTISGLSSLGSGLTVGVYDSTNNVIVATGAQSGDFALVNLYRPSSNYQWDAFTVQANIKIYDASNEYYFGPLKNMYPNDNLRFMGQSSFFDSKAAGTSYWPSSSIHTAQLGTKKFMADCSDAILCYDMETVTEGVPTLGTGVVLPRLVDLSGRGNFASLSGTIGYRSTVSQPTDAAAGLGMKFVASQAAFAFASDGTSLRFGTGDFTISAWLKLTTLPANGVTYQILGKRVANGGNYELQASANSTGTYAVAYVGDSSGQVAFTSFPTTLSAGSLYHIVFTRLSGTATLYLNGVSKASGSASKNTDSSSNLEIGRDPASLSESLDGTVDQVLLYNTASTATRILSLYQSRMPGAPQMYLRVQTNGFPITSRVPYEGTYLYSVATYDTKGNVLTSTDLGRTSAGGGNVTSYTYSTLDGQDYLSKVARPDGREINYAYDFWLGVKYGTLDMDCRRSRTQYDTLGRPVQASVYDNDPNEVLHLDMETFSGGNLKDVSCAGTTDSRNGQTVTLTGTTETGGVEGVGRYFDGATQYLTVSRSTTLEPSLITVSAFIWPATVQLSDIVDKSYPDST